jgi:hypothetical protein
MKQLSEWQYRKIKMENEALGILVKLKEKKELMDE